MLLKHIPLNYEIENPFDFEQFVKREYPGAIKKRILSPDLEIDDRELSEILEAYGNAPQSTMSINEVADRFGVHDKDSLAKFAWKNYPGCVSTETPGSLLYFLNDRAGEIANAYLSQNTAGEMIAAEEDRIVEIARKMPITSGTNFEGYRITRYAGYVSGDEVATIPMGFFTGSITNDDVNETIKRVRNVAIKELKEAAANIGCNAVIGLDFDYITIDRSGAQGTIEVKIVLTANGTAVEIEPL